jgi:hypothetical protein
MKLEIRNSNFETSSKFEIRMLKTNRFDTSLENFEFESFEFVSDFEIRVSNLLLR